MPDSQISGEKSAGDPSLEIQKAERKGAFLVSFPKWAAWAVIAWQIRLSIEALTGKYAFPSLLTRFWRQASIWEVGCWAAGMLGLILGFHSRYLLHKQVAKDLARISSIEKRLDAIAAASGNPTGNPAASGNRSVT